LDRVDLDAVGRILAEMRDWNVSLDSVDLEFLIRRKIERMMEVFRENPENIDPLEELRRLLQFVAEIPVELNYWKAQNIWFEMAKTEYPRYFADLHAGEENGVRWVAEFGKLGELLGFATRTVIPGL
jgi:hypothetical protein